MSAKATIADEADQLAAEAAKALDKAQEAEKRAAGAARRAEERREAEVTAIRRRRLETYDGPALIAAERAAQLRFRDAVLAGDNPIPAFIDWQVEATNRYMLATEAEGARRVLAPETSSLPVGGPPGTRYHEALQAVLDSAIANRAEDFRDELQAELDGAGR